MWVEWCFGFDYSRQLSTWCLWMVGNGVDRFDCQTLNKKLAKLWILWKLRGRLRILKPIFSLSVGAFNTLIRFFDCVIFNTTSGTPKIWHWCCLSVAKPICNSCQGFGGKTRKLNWVNNCTIDMNEGFSVQQCPTVQLYSRCRQLNHSVSGECRLVNGVMNQHSF